MKLYLIFLYKRTKVLISKPTFFAKMDKNSTFNDEIRTTWISNDGLTKTELRILPKYLEGKLFLDSVNKLPKLKEKQAKKTTESDKRASDFEDKIRILYRSTECFAEQNRGFLDSRSFPLDSEKQIFSDVLRDIDGVFLEALQKGKQLKNVFKAWGGSISFSSQNPENFRFYKDTIFEVKTAFSIDEKDTREIKNLKIERALRRLSLKARIVECLKQHDFQNIILYFDGNDEILIKQSAEHWFELFKNDHDFEYLRKKQFFLIYVSYVNLRNTVEQMQNFKHHEENLKNLEENRKKSEEISFMQVDTLNDYRI